MTEEQTLVAIAKLRAAHAALPPLSAAQLAAQAAANTGHGCYLDTPDDDDE